jgi:hypothetical protein
MRTSSLLLAAVVSVALGAGAASAASIWVNSPQVTSYTPLATTGGFKYRISNGSFDFSLDRGTDTGGPAGSFISSNLGNQSFLNGAAYDFTVQHVAGQGIIVTMTRVGGGSTTLSWGTFTTPPPGTNAATLNGIAPTAAFNSIQLQSTASGGNRSATLSNLSFTSGTVPVADGSFTGSTTTNANTPQTQLVVANGNLALENWTLAGRITLTRAGTGAGLDETVKLRLAFVDAAVTIVPEPATAVLLSVGLLGLHAAGRPRRA